MEFEIKPETLFFFIALFGILILHLIPLMRYSLPLNWDSGFYFLKLNQLNDGRTNIRLIMENYLEPFYFLISGLLLKIFGVVPTIKFIQYISIFILSVGTYLFVNRHYDKRTAIIIMFMVAMIPATSRQWADQHRNVLALSFFPLFLYSVLEKEKKYIPVAGVIFGLMGLTHRLIFVFTGITFGLYTFVKLFKFKEEKELFIKNVIVFIIAGIIASPFLIFSLLPSTELQSSTLIKWESNPLDLNYVIRMSGYTILFSICSFIVITNSRVEKKPITETNHLLVTMFGFAFFLFTGIFGTPFLVYERYMLLFCLIASYFSAPYIKGLFDYFEEREKWKFMVTVFMIVFLIYFVIIGWNFLGKLTPFITETEIGAFHWINMNVPKNSTLLIPSREHYWAEALTGTRVIPLEWYELLRQRTPTDEVIVVIGNLQQSNNALERVKEKYNVTDIYVFFTLGSDPILPNDSLQQQVIAQKFDTWEQVNQWGNSYLFKL